MPLSDKGQKIKSKMISQYGEKKGKSIFYAMENSGKLKGVLKAAGGKDASKADFKTPSSAGMSPMSQGYTGAKNTSSTINTGGGDNQVTARKGPLKVPPIVPGSTIINAVSTNLYNRKNLNQARQDDILGGEMLTTGKKQVKQATIPGGNDNSPQLCPDGSAPPCKTPETQIKSPAQKTMFLSGFQSYDDGGEVVISSNVDKSLL